MTLKEIIVMEILVKIPARGSSIAVGLISGWNTIKSRGIFDSGCVLLSTWS